MLENFEAPKKYYSRKAITIATFIGGPLAAGYLMKKNFANNGKSEQGNIVFYLGIILTILTISVIYYLPEEIMEKVPNFIIPAVYTSIIFFAVDKFQGTALKNHEKNNGQFYSAWNAIGIGAICMLMYVGSFFALVVASETIINSDTSQSTFDSEEIQKMYEEKMEKFATMETMALDVFSSQNYTSKEQILYNLKEKGLYYWNENIILLNEINNMNLSTEINDRNTKLKKYCDLRIKSYELLYLSVEEDTDKYELQIKEYHSQIEELLAELITE